MSDTSIRQSRWFKLVWIIPIAVVVVIAVVLFAMWWRGTDSMQSFLNTYPGESELPDFAPVGFPAWLAWQHGLNTFFMLFVIRSGLLVRTTKRPSAFWTRNNTGLIKTKTAPRRISIDLWLHVTVDMLWLLNGVVFYVLIFSTGQWTRIIPTSWDIFPNALSAAIQYASLGWPTEDGWINYNALQVLSYFAVIFIIAPVSLFTGLRLSPAGMNVRWLDKIFPVEFARKLHFPSMIAFVIFIIIHLTLVLATGALRNLNHMYAGNDSPDNWAGLIIFAASVVVMIGVYFALRPPVLRTLAGLMGTVRK